MNELQLMNLPRAAEVSGMSLRGLRRRVESGAIRSVPIVPGGVKRQTTLAWIDEGLRREAEAAAAAVNTAQGSYSIPADLDPFTRGLNRAQSRRK